MNKITERIKTYPVLTGIMLSLTFFIFVMSSLKWFPWLVDSWLNNNANVRSIYFTIVLFAVFTVRPWRERRRNAFVFWASICAFFLIHVSFVFYYSTRVHPILLKEWIVILILESFILSFGIDWLTRRFRTG